MSELWVWIGDEDEMAVRSELARMGIDPGPFDSGRREFSCLTVPVAAWPHFDEQWGRWIWGPVGSLAYDPLDDPGCEAGGICEEESCDGCPWSCEAVEEDEEGDLRRAALSRGQP